MEDRPEYRVGRLQRDLLLPGQPAFWNTIPALKISHYLWLDNGYRPPVEVRLCWSDRNLYVHFDVYEARIRVRFCEFQDPVYKDSCVEMFIDPFPDKARGYVNVETNAAGAALVAIGPDRKRRTPIPSSDLEGFEVVSSVKGPVPVTTAPSFGPWPTGFPWPCSKNTMGAGSCRARSPGPISISAAMRRRARISAPGVPS
jgi:hypothetical protein